MKNLVLSLLAVFAVTIATAQEAKKSPKGSTYTILRKGTGRQIKTGDVITFNFTQKTSKDSVLASSYTKGMPVKIQVNESQNIGDLMDVFTLLSEKDSALVSLPTDSIFKGNEDKRPPFLPAGTAILFTINVERVQTMEEAMAENQKELEAAKTGEKSAREAYIAKLNQALTTTPSGLMYAITKPGSGITAAKGDTVLVNYTGSTVDGKVFDSSIQADAQKAGIFNPQRPYEPIRVVVGTGSVIPGWDEGLLLFSEGSKGLLVIPSELAYGEGGSRDVIKAFSTLRFDIELVKVMKAVPPEEQMRREKVTLDAYLASHPMNLLTTTTGLKYNISSRGTGLKPVKGDTILVNYTGSTLNGRVFDTSVKAEAEKAGLSQPGREYEPIKIVIGAGEVIPGWDEGLLLFPQGSKGTLIIPSDLAYGATGGGDVIPPYSTLRFEVQLVKVIKPKAKAAVKKPGPVKKPTGTPAKKPAATKPATTKPAVKKPAAKS